jgi:hypothetical protein
MFALIVGGLGAHAPAVHAQCAGFTDVPFGGFCGQVTWLKNRQITLGCTSTTLYCPGDPVSRLAMAAFMNRLGNVLTPQVLDDEEAGGLIDLSAGPAFVCQTDTLPAVNYPRTMVAQATISYVLTGLQDLTYGVSIAENAGPLGFSYPLIALNGAGQHQHHYTTVVNPIAAGSTYRFAIRLARLGSRPANISAWTCHLQVSIANAAGSQ